MADFAPDFQLTPDQPTYLLDGALVVKMQGINPTTGALGVVNGIGVLCDLRDNDPSSAPETFGIALVLNQRVAKTLVVDILAALDPVDVRRLVELLRQKGLA